MWQDQTIKVPSHGELEIAPDGNVHVTWKDPNTSFTIIVTPDEIEQLTEQYRQKHAEKVTA